MNTAEQILVIVLATTLAILLVLSIVLVSSLIKLAKTLQLIAMKAENLVDSAEAVGDMVRQTVGHLSIARFIKSMVDMVHHKEKE